jgi:hypothetical protein
MNTLKINGGDSNSKIILGGKSDSLFLKKCIFWESFDKYYKNKKLTSECYPILMSALKTMSPLSKSDTDKSLFRNLEKIYKMKPSKFLIGVVNEFELNKYVSLTLHRFFIVYKEFIEKLIAKAITHRNNLISSMKLKDEKTSLGDLMVKWNELILKYNIDTSSTILFFNFTLPKNKTQIKDKIDSIKWNINFNKTTNKTKKYNKFAEDMKLTKFKYSGFCPYIPLERVIMLLQFPIMPFINLFDDYKFNTAYSIIIKKIKKITLSINPIIKINIIKPSLPKLNPKKPGDVKKLIKLFLNYYSKIMPYVNEHEKSYIKTSKNIESITDVIEGFL